MSDTFAPQDLMKASNGMEPAKHNSPINATHLEALRRTPLGTYIYHGDTFTLQELVEVPNELELSQSCRCLPAGFGQGFCCSCDFAITTHQRHDTLAIASLKAGAAA